VTFFRSILQLNLIANETEKAVFNPQTQVYSRNSSITLRGFKPSNIYRFYCVRVSEQGIYSRSVDITCVDCMYHKYFAKKYFLLFFFFPAPSLDLEITSSGSDTYNKVLYGSDSSYDITIVTIPRSKILLEITRNGISLANDKRFELIPM
jgi:hypothetical protein